MMTRCAFPAFHVLRYAAFARRVCMTVPSATTSCSFIASVWNGVAHSRSLSVPRRACWRSCWRGFWNRKSCENPAGRTVSLRVPPGWKCIRCRTAALPAWHATQRVRLPVRHAAAVCRRCCGCRPRRRHMTGVLIGLLRARLDGCPCRDNRWRTTQRLRAFPSLRANGIGNRSACFSSRANSR
jgi:hypothetical protein